MEFNFIKYNIRPHDTLSSIASRLNITKEDLKNFHNTHCDKINRVWVDNLKDVKFLLVPINYTTEEKTLEKQGQLLPSKEYSIEFHAEHYTIKEEIQLDSGENLSMDYQVDLFTQYKDYKIIVAINRNNFKKNNIEISNKISLLSQACIKSISPIQFNISNNGTLKELSDPQEILKKFKNKRPEIEDFFVGEISKNYLDIFEECIGNENYLFKQLTSTLLSQVLFPNMNWFHKKTPWLQPFCIYPNSFPVNFELTTQHITDNSQIIITRINGYINDNCSLQEIIKGKKFEDNFPEDKLKGEIQLEYHTHTQSKKLLNAQGFVTLWHHEKIYYKHQLTIQK